MTVFLIFKSLDLIVCMKFYQKNDERVEVLLEFVLKMKNGDYDKMCEVLDFTEQGDVVNKLLLTDGR